VIETPPATLTTLPAIVAADLCRCTPFSYYPITIRREPVEGKPINGDEMFVARCEHFPELAMAKSHHSAPMTG